VIVGVGVNVNLTGSEWPADLAQRAISLRLACGHPVSRTVLLAAILNRFEAVYLRWTETGFAPFLEAIQARDALVGRRVTLAHFGRPMVGRARGIAPDGSLLLERANGETLPVWAGDVHIAGVS
jgi:BirA family biotin operon repressor/biotin-[acetyl-CoA-carboxylase] ligase